MSIEATTDVAAPVGEVTEAAAATETSDIDMPAALEEIGGALEKELGIEAAAETPEEKVAREAAETKATADKKAADDKVAAEKAAAKPPEVDPATGKPKVPLTLANGLPQEFRTWRPETQALLLKAQADPALKPLFDEALKREQDMDKGINQYREAASYAEVFRKTLAPFMPMIQHHQLDPMREVTQLMQARMTLALGTPDQKLGLLRGLAKAAGVDFGALGQPEAEVAPEVADLRAKLDTLQSEQLQERQRAQTAQAAQLRTELEAFAADPANRYFGEVAGRIPSLIKSGLAKGYKDAYDMACRLDPVVSAKESQRQADEAKVAADKKAAEEAAAREKAKAANVKSSAKNRSAAAPVGSIEDTLKQTFREIQARE